MRIVAGTRKGTRIAAPKGRRTRPTSDRVREAAFNLIGPLPDDAHVLDLFAGSGALGLEALSRGAASAVFVDNDRNACETIRCNASKLRFDQAEVVRDDACRHALRDIGAGASYDLVLSDPPYEMLDTILTTLSPVLPELVRPGGLLLVESDVQHEPEISLPRRTTRTYGDTRLSLFQQP